MTENPKIWLSSPHMGGGEQKYIKAAFDANWIAPMGAQVDGFEQDLSKFTHSKNVAALSSGTAAIHLALIILGVKAGDEVICQSMTFSASANPIVYQGATPIFIDSEEDTWNMDPQLLKEAIIDRISKGKKPKAIIPVHLYGMPAKMNEIMEIAREYEIPVIEDAAEALGSKLNGQAMGTFGDLGVLSFNGNKIITTSGGGALLSENENYINMARFLATQARDAAPHYEHTHIGYNYRLSNISAAIGRGQMEVLEDWIALRRANFERYKSALSQYDSLQFSNEPGGMFSNRWLTAILIKPQNKNELSREALRLSLEAANIDSRPLWKPMHLQPIFSSAPFYGSGVSEKLFQNGLCLPSGSNLSNEDLNKVIHNIETAINQKESVV